MGERHLSSSQKQIGNQAIKEKIFECHKKFKGIYGYRRILVWLRLTYNLFINHKRVQRLMSELGIQADIRKKRPYTERRKLISCQTTTRTEVFKRQSLMKSG